MPYPVQETTEQDDPLYVNIVELREKLFKCFQSASDSDELNGVDHELPLNQQISNLQGDLQKLQEQIKQKTKQTDEQKEKTEMLEKQIKILQKELEAMKQNIKPFIPTPERPQEELGKMQHIVNKHREYIVENMIVGCDLYPYFIQEGVLTDEEVEKLKAKGRNYTNNQQSVELLNVLMWKSDETMHTLVHALKETGQGFIADKITSDEGYT